MYFDKTDNNVQPHSGPALRMEIARYLFQIGLRGDLYVPEVKVLQAFRESASAQEIREAIRTLESNGSIMRFDHWRTGKPLLAHTSLLERLGKICPECRSLDLLRDADRGETVCGNCGTVPSDKDMVPSFLGARPPRDKITDDGMSLVSSLPHNFEREYVGSNASLPGSAGLKVFLMRDPSVRQHENFAEIDRVCQRVKASPVIRREAARLFIRLLGTGKKMGFGRRSLMTAIVLAAYRMHGYPMELGRICTTRKISVVRAYRKLKQLGIFWSEIVRPTDCIDRILSRPEIAWTLYEYEGGQRMRLRKQATELVQSWESSGATAGKSPYVVAAVAIREASLRNRVKLPVDAISEAAAYIDRRSIFRLRASLRSRRTEIS
jgi:transcription initiation factor TFIIB